jgi:hypothetical protein
LEFDIGREDYFKLDCNDLDQVVVLFLPFLCAEFTPCGRALGSGSIKKLHGKISGEKILTFFFTFYSFKELIKNYTSFFFFLPKTLFMFFFS